MSYHVLKNPEDCMRVNDLSKNQIMKYSLVQRISETQGLLMWINTISKFMETV